MSQEPAADTPWVWGRRQAVHLGALTFARLCLNMGLRLVYPFAPAFARGLGVPITSIYLLISARNLVSLFSPLFAPLPERFGRRMVMVLGTLLFGAAALVAAGIPTIWALGLAILISGLAKVTFDPSMQAYLGDTVPYDQRGRAMSVTEFAWSGAFLIGAPIAGWLIANQGWQSPWLWLGLLSIGAAVLLWRVLPATRHHPATIVPITYTWHVARRHPVIWAAAGFMMFTMLAQETLFIVYGDWMEGSFGLSLTSLGLATTLIGVAELSGEALAGLSVDRFGKRPVVILAGLLNALIYLTIPLSSGNLNATLVVLVLLFVTFEITVVGAIPLLTELVPGARGAVMSISLGAMAAGRLIGSVVGPFVWDKAGITGNSLLSASVMILAVIVLALWVRE